MTRSATFAAAALALSAMAATPAEAFVLAPPMPIADRGQGECAAGPVLPVGRRFGNQEDCASPALAAGRHIAKQDECAAALAVGVQLVSARTAHQDGCAGTDPLVLVGRTVP